MQIPSNLKDMAIMAIWSQETCWFVSSLQLHGLYLYFLNNVHRLALTKSLHLCTSYMLVHASMLVGCLSSVLQCKITV